MIIDLKFSKMHGLGNDYVVVDESESEIIPEDKKPLVSRELCKRRFSVGADGVIFVAPNIRKEADIRFRIFNADGSEAEMCGNGIRCFAKYVYQKNILPKENMLVDTMQEIKELNLQVEKNEVTSIRVDMGLASFNTSDVPMKTEDKEFLDNELLIGGNPIKMSVLSVGNPHAVSFTDNLKKVPLKDFGPLIECHELFPERINAHFVHIMERKELEMITWERGAGVTLACGTGATASVLAGYRLGLLDEDVLVHLPGGDLHITVYHEGDRLGAYMEGDAVMVFEGEIELDF